MSKDAYFTKRLRTLADGVRVAHDRAASRARCKECGYADTANVAEAEHALLKYAREGKR